MLQALFCVPGTRLFAEWPCGALYIFRCTCCILRTQLALHCEEIVPAALFWYWHCAMHFRCASVCFLLGPKDLKKIERHRDTLWRGLWDAWMCVAMWFAFYTVDVWKEFVAAQLGWLLAVGEERCREVLGKSAVEKCCVWFVALWFVARLQFCTLWSCVALSHAGLVVHVSHIQYCHFTEDLHSDMSLWDCTCWSGLSNDKNGVWNEVLRKHVIWIAI